MNGLVHIMDRLFGQPLFLLPSKAEAIAGVILSRTITDAPVILEAGGGGDIDASRFVGTRSRETRPNALARASEGVAIIDIVGSLVNRGGWIGAYSGVVSYEGIAAQIDDAVRDPEVRSILLDINSPGGEATGMFALAEKVRAAAEAKNVVAVVNDMAASAAYGIASGAREIVISPTSIVGSIGVVMMHVDRSQQQAAAGIVETAIYAGAHKVDGLGPLTPETKASLQAMVDTFYGRFVDTVAVGRGSRTTAEMARGTEARVYIGRDAIAAGLADRVASFDQVLSEMKTRPTNRRPTSKGSTMSQNTNINAEATDGVPEATVAARVEAARAEGKREGIAEGVVAERARISAIVNHPDAKGREAQALAIATKSDMSAEVAATILQASPVASGVLPIADRAGGPEAGAGHPGGVRSNADTAANTSALWDKVLKQVNPSLAR